MTKNYFEQESGRSMVEMLGVLAIIGVLSVGGISGYTTAMNKHKANEILNAAAVRAMAVSTQLQSGAETPTLGEFDSNEKIGGATFTGVDKVGDNQFKLTFGDKPTTDVLKQMQNIAGDNVGVDITRLLYNNDLSSGVNGKNTNKNEDGSCKTGQYSLPDCEKTCSGDHKSVVDDECVCDEGYELEGNECKSAGTLYTLGNTGVHYNANNLSSSLYINKTTPAEDICPTGYRWAEYDDVKNFDAAMGKSLFDDQSLCDNCYWEDQGVLWIQSCVGDCNKADSAYCVDNVFGLSTCGRAHSKYYTDALCIKKS